eukprot:SAG25_NODE_841_length_5118_cov_6.634389_3_plen_126_part_00
MILDHLAYTGVADPELLTIPIEVVEFYGNLWGASKKNDTDDTMVFFPTQALETWQVQRPLRPATCGFDWDFPLRCLFLSRNIEGATDVGSALAGLWIRESRQSIYVACVASRAASLCAPCLPDND